MIAPNWNIIFSNRFSNLILKLKMEKIMTKLLFCSIQNGLEIRLIIKWEAHDWCNYRFLACYQVEFGDEPKDAKGQKKE